MEDDSHAPIVVGITQLAAIVGLFSGTIECVLLNACHSAWWIEALKTYIPTVVGMDKALSDEAAIDFAVSFYDALGAGQSISFAYALTHSVMQAATMTSPKSLTVNANQ